MVAWARRKPPCLGAPQSLPPLPHFRRPEVRTLLHNILQEVQENPPSPLAALLWVLLPMGSLPIPVYGKPWFFSAVEHLRYLSYNYKDLPFSHRLWLGATVAYRFAPRRALGVPPILWYGRRFLIHILTPQAKHLAHSVDGAVLRLSHHLAYDGEVIAHFAILRSFHGIRTEDIGGGL